MPHLIPVTDDELRQAYAMANLDELGITFDHAARLGGLIRRALECCATARRRREARQARAAAIPHQILEDA